jgi:hypothetical protein
VIKLLGVLLLALPFIFVIVVMARKEGWRVTLAVWGITLGMLGSILGGVALLSGGLW